MSRLYAPKVEQVTRQVLIEHRCDGCNRSAEELGPYPFIEVAIEVHLDEEGGRRDEYEYCDDCLRERAPLLVAAGSRAELVTGEAVSHE